MTTTTLNLNDHYFILGVSKTATGREIKEAFRKLCLKYHPDKTEPTAHNRARYVEICEAYKVLSNKERRAKYDKKLATLAAASQTQGIGKVKAALYPEISTTVRGHYPWLAAFAIIIVAALALAFSYSNTTSYYTDKAVQHPAPPRQIPPQSISVAGPQTDTSPADIQAAPVADTASTAATPADDSSELYKTKIVSTLSEITPWKQQKVTPIGGGNVRPYEEWDFRYSFSGGKLVVTYRSDEYGSTVRNKVIIPAKDVSSVYFYNDKLWISSKRRSILMQDAATGKKQMTEFFAVKTEKERSSLLEKELTEAFRQLRSH